MSKTICIYHSRDLDGWMSAAIVKKWFKENHENPIFWNLKNVFATDLEFEEKESILSLLGWDYGNGIPDLTSYDTVIMVDVSFPKKEMKDIGNRLAARFIWIDHHISAINDSKGVYDGLFGARDTEFAACELTWKHLFIAKPMPEIVRLLGRYDCFGHKGTDEEQKVLEFQYAARAYMTNYEDCYKRLMVNINMAHKDSLNIHWLQTAGKAIYKYLCTEARQIYAKAFPVEFAEQTEEIAEETSRPVIKVRKFLCVNQERFNPINFGIDYHKDGYDGFACFCYKNGEWTFSLYNDNGKVDCSAIARLHGGGGHKGAAGFVTKIIGSYI